jgi:chromosome segregation ATPase
MTHEGHEAARSVHFNFDDITLSAPDTQQPTTPAVEQRAVPIIRMSADTVRLDVTQSLQNPAAIPSSLQAKQPEITPTEALTHEPTPHERYVAMLDGISSFEQSLDIQVTSQRTNIGRAQSRREVEFQEIEKLYRREAGEDVATGLKVNHIEQDGKETAQQLVELAARRLELEVQIGEVDRHITRHRGSLSTTQRSLQTSNGEYDVALGKLRQLRDTIATEQSKIDSFLAASRLRYSSLDESNFANQDEMVHDPAGNKPSANPNAVNREEFLTTFINDPEAPQKWETYKAYPDNLRHVIREARFITPDKEKKAREAKEQIAAQYTPQLVQLQSRVDVLSNQIDGLRQDERTSQLQLREVEQQRDRLLQQLDQCLARIQVYEAKAAEAVMRLERVPTIPSESLLIRAASNELRSGKMTDLQVERAAQGLDVSLPTHEVAKHIIENDNGRPMSRRRLELSARPAAAPAKRKIFGGVIDKIVHRHSIELDN